jgi:surface polysaccharide O-acyltransferase-like enzyme
VSGFFGYMLIAFYIRKFVPALSWAKTLSLSVPLFAVGMAIMAGGFYFLIPGGSSYPVHQPYGAAVRLEMTLEYCSLGVAAATVSLFLVIRKFTAEGWFYNRIIRPASEASYGTYLMHMIILAPLAGYFKGTLPTPASVIVVAFLSFVVSTFVSCLIRRIPLVGRFIAG